ncbi:MAG: 3-hydroxyacyl-CoA dehydrogenase NAD-binding domain-containing protein, partial [Deltaproteobacteria bacterium]
MMKEVKKAGVVGAGVMGAAIAAHLANAGIQVVLLDIVPGELTQDDKEKGYTKESREFRNKLAEKGLDIALKSKPASFYLPENARLITVGNMEDNWGLLGEVDWIIEVVLERLDIKRSVFAKVEQVMSPKAIVTSNTSGILARSLCEGRSDNFRRNFAITHFFNPPRYMKLVEIVPGPDTSPEILESLASTCEKRLGKGVVFAKDTPNFVANRIGVFNVLYTIRTMLELGLTIEAVDKLTGPVIGHPKSATFRTADLVGLDTLVHVAQNVYDGVLTDEKRETFKAPDLVRRMIDHNYLGEKTKQGFYKKSRDSEGNRVILSLDHDSLQYGPQEKVKLASLEMAKTMQGTARKIESLYYARDVGGQFTFRTLTETLVYSANRISEIADDIVNVDRAMKWGFGWKMGPFETWDALGLEKSVGKIKDAGYEVPYWVQEMLDAGNPSFYKREAGVVYYYDVVSKDYKEVSVKPGIILLPSLKEREKK